MRFLKNNWALGRQALIETIQEAGFTQVCVPRYRKPHPQPDDFFKKMQTIELRRSVGKLVTGSARGSNDHSKKITVITPME
jgi:hypothetical protein